MPAIKWPVLGKTISNKGGSSEKRTDQILPATPPPIRPIIGRLYAKEDVPSLQGPLFFSPPSSQRSEDDTTKVPVEAASGQEGRAWSGIELPFMLWPTKDDRPAHLSLRGECMQGVSRTNNTNIPIFSSRIKTDHFSNEPNSERHLTHPGQPLGKANPEPQAGPKEVNYSLAMSTPKHFNHTSTKLEDIRGAPSGNPQ